MIARIAGGLIGLGFVAGMICAGLLINLAGVCR